MSPPLRTTRPGCAHHAGDELARERLSAYRRYAEVVAAQEAALDKQDMQAFEALSREALALQQEVGTLSMEGFTPDGCQTAGTCCVDQVTELHHAAMAHKERVHARLGGHTRAPADGRHRVGTYGQRSMTEDVPSVDVRF